MHGQTGGAGNRGKAGCRDGGLSARTPLPTLPALLQEHANTRTTSVQSLHHSQLRQDQLSLQVGIFAKRCLQVLARARTPHRICHVNAARAALSGRQLAAGSAVLQGEDYFKCAVGTRALLLRASKRGNMQWQYCASSGGPSPTGGGGNRTGPLCPFLALEVSTRSSVDFSGLDSLGNASSLLAKWDARLTSAPAQSAAATSTVSSAVHARDFIAAKQEREQQERDAWH